MLVNGELAHYATTFADVPPGELLLYEDAYRTLALAVNRGSAAAHLGLDARRRGPHPAGVSATLGAPAAAPARHDVDQRPRPRARAAGAPHGTLVTAGEQRAGPRTPGPDVVRAAGPALLLSLVLRDPPAAAAARRRRSPSPRSRARAR